MEVEDFLDRHWAAMKVETDKVLMAEQKAILEDIFARMPIPNACPFIYCPT